MQSAAVFKEKVLINPLYVPCPSLNSRQIKSVTIWWSEALSSKEWDISSRCCEGWKPDWKLDLLVPRIFRGPESKIVHECKRCLVCVGSVTSNFMITGLPYTSNCINCFNQAIKKQMRVKRKMCEIDETLNMVTVPCWHHNMLNHLN